jgi:preprotein translocase subunit SecD
MFKTILFFLSLAITMQHTCFKAGMSQKAPSTNYTLLLGKCPESAQVQNILSNRFLAAGYTSKNIRYTSSGDTLRVHLQSAENNSTIENLLVKKGAIGFYEVYPANASFMRYITRADSLLRIDYQSKGKATSHKPFSDLVVPAAGKSSYIAYIAQSDITQLWSLLNTVILADIFPKDLHFALSDHPVTTINDQILYGVYALKSTNDTTLSSTLNNDHIAKSYAIKTASKEAGINIELTPIGSQALATLSRKNINKPLAIAIDGTVITAPLVQEAIEGGKVQITGSYSTLETRIISSILTNAILPCDLQLLTN